MSIQSVIFTEMHQLRLKMNGNLNQLNLVSRSKKMKTKMIMMMKMMMEGSHMFTKMMVLKSLDWINF